MWSSAMPPFTGANPCRPAGLAKLKADVPGGCTNTRKRQAYAHTLEFPAKSHYVLGGDLCMSSSSAMLHTKECC